MKPWCDRNALRSRRRALSEELVAAVSSCIAKTIVSLPVFVNSQHIALYVSHENEVDLSGVVDHAFELKKTLYLPIFSEPCFLKFYRVDASTVYQKNKFGILEPISDDLITADALDLMLIPLVAFDQHCHRIGRGLGCYDRYLQAARHCKLMGVAYEFQKVDCIVPEKWDVSMDYIVTESTIYP